MGDRAFPKTTPQGCTQGSAQKNGRGLRGRATTQARRKEAKSSEGPPSLQLHESYSLRVGGESRIAAQAPVHQPEPLEPLQQLGRLWPSSREVPTHTHTMVGFPGPRSMLPAPWGRQEMDPKEAWRAAPHGGKGDQGRGEGWCPKHSWRYWGTYS
jgi:hypothetical protein